MNELTPDEKRFLTAYVSRDGRVVGIEHETVADWSEVRTAHVALRDRINERLAEEDKCPFKPTRPTAVGRAMNELKPSEAEEMIFARLCAKYVQRADARQQSMGLQYTEAETHDLARFIATLRPTPVGIAELADELERRLIAFGDTDEFEEINDTELSSYSFWITCVQAALGHRDRG